MARNGAVHAVVIGRDATDRREGRLAPGPEQLAFGLALAGPERRRAAAFCNLAHLADQVIDLDLGAVELDDEQGLDIERIAGVAERLGGRDGRLVHDLHAAGDDAGGDHQTDAFTRRLNAREADQQRPGGRRLAQDAHGDLGDHAEQSFRAGHHAEQVIAS